VLHCGEIRPFTELLKSGICGRIQVYGDMIACNIHAKSRNKIRLARSSAIQGATAAMRLYMD